jgi:hypothetical protein
MMPGSIKLSRLLVPIKWITLLTMASSLTYSFVPPQNTVHSFTAARHDAYGMSSTSYHTRCFGMLLLAKEPCGYGDDDEDDEPCYFQFAWIEYLSYRYDIL